MPRLSHSALGWTLNPGNIFSPASCSWKLFFPMPLHARGRMTTTLLAGIDMPAIPGTGDQIADLNGGSLVFGLCDFRPSLRLTTGDVAIERLGDHVGRTMQA